MKIWIKTNLSKITLALALTGAVTGTIGLIMGGVACFTIIGGIYISTFIINNHELNKMNLIELLKSDE